jgi:chromosome segregation protein
MTYIKRLVMKGFKSFVKQTEIPLDHGINVVLGPNGSGKSNVSDALCFVLGRLSAKSMRAAKAKNLIFMGTKSAAPAKEAAVEIVFDNSAKVFALEDKEISIKRIVRKNGQSIYKINNETKTRQEILALLAQAGIDPNGFNIILQGEIQNFVRMHTEERRKIIEEVSGISIYESRKKRSIKELEKTDEKLKEVLAILRERTAYLNNLEKERQQALRFKKLEKDVKRYKASIISTDLNLKKKKTKSVIEEIEKKNKEIEKIKKLIVLDQSLISSIEQKITQINSTMQKSTGVEQEQLNREIANLRAELAGTTVKIENLEIKILQIQKQKQELNGKIRQDELELKELQKTSGSVEQDKKQKDLSTKKQELEKLEEQRKKFYMIKTELRSIRERFQDKTSLLKSFNNESDFLLKEIESLTLELFDKRSNPEKVNELKTTLIEKQTQLEELNQREVELDKLSHTNEYEISNQNNIIEKISKIDICPLCKSKITEEHIKSIGDEVKPKIESLKKEIEESDKELNKIYNQKQILKKDIEQIQSEVSKRESDLSKLSHIYGKKNQIKVLQEKIESSGKEVQELEKRKKFLEANFEENLNIEQKYETTRVEVQEISLRNDENIDSEISFKQREIERAKINLKQLKREEQDIEEDLTSLKKETEEKERLLVKKNKQDEILSQRFQKLISERDDLQIKIRETESKLSQKRNSIHLVEQEINNFRIDKARYDAEVENLEMEMLEFPNIEIIHSNKESLQQKLARTQDILSKIGSVNLRSLEVYDEIKREYDSVKEKAEIINKEKESILRIIHEIDIKKKKVFMQTFQELNNIFSRNFAQISTKGQVSLELENKKEPFEAGVGIVVKTGHGKYFDVTSLSGGEQTMVALSLIFAIQELSPYAFYILDEIDAALDKRNSERLANLLKKYMQKGQYIVITHNDEIINSATNIYGVSMHDGISKVVSLKI